MQEADSWRKQSLWPYLTSFLPVEKSPTWPGLPGRSMSWPGCSGHTLWSGVECPGLQATSCQAFRVTRRGPVCASAFQDGCGPSRETPREGFPLLHSGPHPHGSLQPPQAAKFPGAGGGSRSHSQGGRRVALYKSAKKEAGLPCD